MAAAAWILLWGVLAVGCSDASPSAATLQIAEYALKFRERGRPLAVVSTPDVPVPAIAWLENLADFWRLHGERLAARSPGDLSGARFAEYSTHPEYARLEAARASIQAGSATYWHGLESPLDSRLSHEAFMGLLVLPYLYPSDHETFRFYQELLRQILRHGSLSEIASVFRVTSTHSVRMARASLGDALQALDAPVIAGLLHEDGAMTSVSLIAHLRAGMLTEKEARQLLPVLEELWSLAASVEHGQVDWCSLGRSLAALAESGLGGHGMLLGLDWESVVAVL